MSKQATWKFNVKRFNFKTINEAEVQEKYQYKPLKRCCGELKMIRGDFKRARENITHIIQISGKESIHLDFRSSQWCS